MQKWFSDIIKYLGENVMILLIIYGQIVLFFFYLYNSMVKN